MSSNQNRTPGVFAALVVTTFLACSLFAANNPHGFTSYSYAPLGRTAILQADGTAPPPPPPPSKQQHSRNASLA